MLTAALLPASRSIKASLFFLEDAEVAQHCTAQSVRTPNLGATPVCPNQAAKADCEHAACSYVLIVSMQHVAM